MTADEIRRDVEAFLAKGKKIEVIPFGVPAESGISKYCFCGCKGDHAEHIKRAESRTEAIALTKRGGVGKRKTKAPEGY